MAKLKSELVNIIYMLPEKPMRWVDRDEIAATPISTAPLTAAAAAAATVPIPANVDVASAPDLSVGLSMAAITGEKVTTTALTSFKTSITISNSNAISALNSADGEGDTDVSTLVVMKTDEEENVELVTQVPPDPIISSQLEVIEAPKETKVERKLKRRLKRRQNNERIMTLIQIARTPQELLAVLIEVEEAIPKVYKYTLNDEALPSTADTCAALAVRIYVLDRRIRYDEIKDVEKQGMERQYRPRYQFSPRCLMSSSCNKFLSHLGKCLQDSPLLTGTGSRIPDINDVMFNYTSNNNINPGGYVQRSSTGTYNIPNRYA